MPVFYKINPITKPTEIEIQLNNLQKQRIQNYAKLKELNIKVMNSRFELEKASLQSKFFDYQIDLNETLIKNLS